MGKIDLPISTGRFIKGESMPIRTRCWRRVGRPITLALLAFALLVPIGAAPQQPAAGVPDVAELQRLARLPEARQRDNAVQTRLTAWFLHRVQVFQTILAPHAVGSLVNLGDFAAYRRRMALMGGDPSWVVIFAQGRSPQKEPGEPFWMPGDNSAFSTYAQPSTMETEATCWHEVQHGLLAGHTIQPQPYGSEHEEHVYIELLAERTVSWLLALNGRLEFETRVREAAARAAEYTARGATITLDVERNLWAATNKAWRSAWPKPSGIPAALPETWRQEYRTFAGVAIPTVEEVIGFYMAGGVKDTRNVPIRVPEWVMNSNPLLAAVGLVHDPRSSTSEAKSGVLRHRFTFTPRGLHYAPGGQRRFDPVTRGTLVVKLDTDDDNVTLGLALGGRSLAGISGPGGASLRRFAVSLATVKAELDAQTPFTVTLNHRHPEQVSGKKTFQIGVEYADAPDAGGERFFQSSKALFWVDVTGPASPAPSPAAPKPGAPTSGAPASASTGGERWVLHAVRKSSGPPDPTFNRVWPAYTLRTLSSSTDGSFTAESESTPTIPEPRGRASKSPNVHRTAVDIRWSQPPSVLRPGETASMDLAVKTTHAVVNTSDPIGANLSGEVSVRVTWGSDIDSTKPEISSFLGGSDGWPYWWGNRDGYIAKVRYNESARASFRLPDASLLKSAKPPVRAGTHYGCHITVTVYAAAGRDDLWGWVGRDYIYVFEEGTGGATPTPPPPAGPVGSELRSDLPPEPPDDPLIDNKPPKNGEVNSTSVPKPGASAPKKGPQAVWYTHPEGYYRIRLLPGWRVITPSPAKSTDCLGESAGSVFFLLPGRSHGTTADPVAAIHRLADEWAATHTARRTDFTVGGRPASRVGYQSESRGQPIVQWHVVVAHPQHTFYLAAWVPVGLGTQTLPAPIQQILDSLEFLK